MRVTTTELAGLFVVEPVIHLDDRGSFHEIWNSETYATLGVGGPFLQDNVSVSKKGVIRGLHLQISKPQGKLVYVLAGSVFDVAVDLRPESSTHGKWFGTTISSDNRRQIWIPPGFAHGFCVLSDAAVLCYKCTATYNPAGERSIRWNDPDLGIDWPVRNPILGQRDAISPLLRDSDIRALQQSL